MNESRANGGVSAASATAPGSIVERPVVLVLALFVLAAVSYAGSLDHPFVYDDLPTVLKNPRIRSLDNIPAIIGVDDAGFSPRSRWTREVTHAVEYALVGAWPPLFHATNIALHGIAAWLVFLLVGAMSERRWLGWWTAALFAAHPIQSEVVAHVSGRRGLLAAVFSLISLLLLLRYTKVGGWWRVALASVTVYLASYSKELGAMTPAVFMMVDGFLALRREPERPWAKVLGERVRTHAGLYGWLTVLGVGLAASLLFLTRNASGIDGSPSFYDSSGEPLGLLARLSVVGLALRLIAMPLGQSVDYSYDALGFVTAGGGARLALDLAVFAAAAGIAVYGIRRRSWAGLAGLWFALYHLPHVGLVRWHEIFAERFVYLPSIGVFVGIAAAGLWAVERFPRGREAVLWGSAIVVAVLSVATIQRTEVWSDELTLWSNAVERYPNAVRARKALGDAFLAETRTADAIEQYREAARVYPNYVDAQVAVAIAMAQRMDLGQALTQLDVVLERWPDEPRAWNLKGYIDQTLGRPDDALAAYQRAVEANPRFADGYNNMARLYAERGEIDRVVEMYEKALEINPAMTTALKNLAVVYREAYQDEERAAHYDRLFDEAQDAR